MESKWNVWWIKTLPVTGTQNKTWYMKCTKWIPRILSHIQVLEERTRGLEYKLDQSQNRIKQLEWEKNQLQINFKDSFENFIIPSCYAFEVILKGWKPWHFSYLYNNKTTYTMFFCSSIGRTGMNKNGFDLLIKTKAEQPFQRSRFFDCEL